jgi:hypothetical protein
VCQGKTQQSGGRPCVDDADDRHASIADRQLSVDGTLRPLAEDDGARAVVTNEAFATRYLVPLIERWMSRPDLRSSRCWPTFPSPGA